MKIICPHCNANDGFYVREQVTGTATVYYTNKGDYANENGQIYDSLVHKGGKLAYCSSCSKIIGKSDKLKSGNVEKETHW